MGSTVRYTYRLRPGAGATAGLDGHWDAVRWVWNRCVEYSQRRHRAGLSSGPAELDRMLTKWRNRSPWLGAQPTVPQQQAIRDFSQARSRCLKAWSEGNGEVGYPRFKSYRRDLPSMNYTRRGFSLTTCPETGRARLRLAGGHTIPVVWSRPLPSAPSSVRVYRDAIGHWWASFVVEVEDEPLPATGNQTGIDWGLSRLATAADPDFDAEHPRHALQAEKRLAHYQRQMARRWTPGKPGSKRYRKAKIQAAKTHRKARNQRLDDARKWAKRIVRNHDRIATEDLRPGFMSKSRSTSRSAADAGINISQQALAHMARKHRRTLVAVHPAYTSMTCSKCGVRAKHRIPLSCRTFDCRSCETSIDRDRNAAINMMDRAGFNPTGAEGIRPDPANEREPAA